MDVQVAVFVEVGRNAESVGLRADVRQRGLRRLLHHVSELAGQRQALLAGHARGFDEQDVPAVRRPGQPDRHARLLGPLGHFGEEFHRPQKIGQVRFGHRGLVGLPLGHRTRDFPAHRADFALQVAHPGLVRVAARDAQQRVVPKRDPVVGQAVLRDLLGQDVALGDLQLFFLGVAGQFDDLHAVLERGRNRLQIVGGRDEHDLGQVERHVQVMVGEGEVLFRVQHFQQGRGRVAPEVHAQLVDFVQHEQRVVRAGGAQRLDDAPGQRADVRPAVAADLGLVAHAPERQAHELAAHRARNRTPERRLAHPRRPGETQDRPLGILFELAHGQIFEDAVLDLFEVVVVFVQDVARVRNVEVVLGRHRPGQVDEPFQIGPHHRVFGRLGRDDLEALEFVVGRLERGFGHLGLVDLLAQFVQLAGARVAFAQLLLNGPHLLAEVEFLLVLVEFGLHLGLNLLPQFQQFELAVQDRGQFFDARPHVERIEQILLLVHRDVQVGGDQIRHLGRILDVHHHALQLVGQVGHRGHELSELADHVRLAGVQVAGLLGLALQRRDPGAVVRFEFHVFPDVDAPEPLHENAHAPVRVFQHLEDAAGAAARKERVGGRGLVFGVLLRREAEHVVGVAAVLDEGEGRGAGDQQRDDGGGEDHDSAQRQDGQGGGDFDVTQVFFESDDAGFRGLFLTPGAESDVGHTHLLRTSPYVPACHAEP